MSQSPVLRKRESWAPASALCFPVGSGARPFLSLGLSFPFSRKGQLGEMVSIFNLLSGRIFVLSWEGEARREEGRGREDEGFLRKWPQGSSQGSGEDLERHNRHISCQGCLKAGKGSL